MSHSVRLNYKDLYENAMDLCKIGKICIVLSLKSIYPVASCVLCLLPTFQADLKRLGFKLVEAIRFQLA